MKAYTLLLICASVALAAANNRADPCTAENCDSTNGCICINIQSPLPIEETPQFVVITFDDAIIDNNYLSLYEPLLFSRTNPDGSPIGATFYIPHKYTNYTRVNDLYNKGFEIGDNSITKNPLASYWADASVEDLVKEFAGQKEIISLFANIPAEDIVGGRTPNLQIAGNNTIEAYIQAELKYDNSWPSLSTRKVFPYTLDHASNQQCIVGKCPTGVYPGFFISPIINILGVDNTECNALFGCQMSGTAQELFEWLKAQFDRVYTNNKAPQTYMFNSVWFQFTENSHEAFGLFLDYMSSLNDVFLISHTDVQAWMLNPVPLAEYKTPIRERNAACAPVNCPLQLAEEIIYMGSCVACPNVYPWLDNPTGA